MTENVHFVTVTVVDADHEPIVKFECRAAPTAPCRNYPDWDDEADYQPADEHPSIPQAECWIESWFREGSAYYVGGEWDAQPEFTADQSGPIRYENDDETFEWAFIDPLPTTA